MANPPNEITYPNTIANGDTPDWDLVMDYFNAVRTLLETDGLTDGNLDLNFFDLPWDNVVNVEIDAADVVAGSLTADELAPLVYEEDDDTLTSALPATWENLAAVTVPEDGTYRIVADVRWGSTYNGISGVVQLNSRLVRVFTAFGFGYEEKNFRNGGEGDQESQWKEEEINELLTGETVTVQVKSSFGTLGYNDWSGRIRIEKVSS